MDRLQTIDTAFLDLEDSNVQANIGGACIFDGPAPSVDEVVARTGEKLALVPRYRQRLQFMPLRLGRPVWVDDPRFDVRRHVHRRRLASPGSHTQLFDLYAKLAGHHLDRARPLWDVCLVEGLADGHWALLWRVHHALVDGVAASDLLMLMLDFDREPEPIGDSRWKPRPTPDARQIARASISGALEPARELGGVPKALGRPGALARRARTTARAALPWGRSAVAARRSPLNGPIGPHRRWAGERVDLHEIKTIAKATGCTVNDVILAAVNDGLRELLKRRDESLGDVQLRTMVPVSVRTANQAGEVNNHVSAVFVDLPVAEPDPIKRLRALHEQMAHYKATEGAIAGEVLFDLGSYLPAGLFSAAERVFFRVTEIDRLMNTVTTNVPGPQVPLYCLGREMTECYPYVMLAKNIRVATAIFSYNGGVHFGVSADHDSVPDVQAVCDGIRAGIDGLLAASARGPRRAPAQV